MTNLPRVPGIVDSRRPTEFLSEKLLLTTTCGTALAVATVVLGVDFGVVDTVVVVGPITDRIPIGNFRQTTTIFACRLSIELIRYFELIKGKR